ncbi:acyltransferase [Longispora sp. K20-0274]|uniref:acyltransferase family protein n=1 Tax=Longispora sp. K20-0274 TaxID=3088255 RepID=UPI00399C02B3
MTSRRFGNWGLLQSRGTLDDLFSGRENSVGFLRLMLAVGVVASHARPLGFLADDLGFRLFREQTNVGNLSVFGFFALSGLLITRSARRTGILRYMWHRALRIFPGLWVCLLVTALVVAPLIALHERGTMAGFWAHPWAADGPLSYLRANWWTGVRQWGIQDLLARTTPWGRSAPDPAGVSVFNGALWSLSYEMLCYVMIGILAVTGILRGSRRFVLLLAALTYVWIVRDFLDSTLHDGAVRLPLIGGVSFHLMIYLACMFLIGAVLDLYRERIPVHDGLALLAGAVFVGSLLLGGFFVFGMPAYAYLLIWFSIRLPRRLHGVGRNHDYSYGVYIYGFLGQQVLVSFGANRWGYLPFVALSMLTAFAAAFLSWHLVESPAMRLKHWSPLAAWRRSRTAPPADDGTVPDTMPTELPEVSVAPAAVTDNPGLLPRRTDNALTLTEVDRL